MARTNLISTRTTNYMELIGNGKAFRVPPYQRDYSWSEEQWEDIWTDIRELATDSDRSHYLGALVVEPVSDLEFLVIDGQQRLASLSLLTLAVISRLTKMAEDAVESENNRKRAKALRARFIGERDPASLVEISRLHLNETDNGFFQDNLIQLRPPPNPRRLPRSNKLLWDCFRYFQERIEQQAEYRNDGQLLAGLISSIVARQLMFILITVEGELSAYTVFETLNARGLELTTTDLLKNYLFSRISSASDMDSVQRRWRSLVGTVGQPRFPEFLRYHMLCDQPKVRSQRLFKMVRDQTRSGQEVFALLEVLEGRSELFAAVLDPNHEFWLNQPEAKPYVAELNLFRVRQPMPLLFAAWEKFTPEDFVRILKLVARISFRYNVVSRLNTNALEPVYHRAAKQVLQGKAHNPAMVFSLLSTVYVDDEKMKNDFENLEFDVRGGRRKLAKYILAKIEGHLSERACDPDTDPGTIEHILPENAPETCFDEFPFETQDRWVHRLGNLTLLEAPLNRDVGNECYPIKRKAYVSSAYKITSQIPHDAPEEWAPALLSKRQRFLAKQAAHVWRSDFA